MDLRSPARQGKSPDYLKSPAGSSVVGMVALAALPIICCGLPLVVTARVPTGGAGWLIVHGSLLGLPLLNPAAGPWWWRSRGGRC